jgi:HK97 gp10 family phage protein
VKSFRRDAEIEMDRELKRRFETAAIVGEGEVKKRAPVDTGRLRASYTHDSDETGAIIGTNTHYAPYLELGTRYMEPRPHLVTGVVSAIPQMRRILGGK